MSPKKNKRVYKIPSPEEQIKHLPNPQTKYKLGEEGWIFHAIKNLKPNFAFDYISLNRKELCFNHKNISRKDLLGFIEGLKKISGHTYEELKETKSFRFHKIDFDDKQHKIALRKSDFLKVLAPSRRALTESELPTLYQIDIQYVSEARIIGFLFKGVFYIIWYDRFHKNYGGKS